MIKNGHAQEGVVTCERRLETRTIEREVEVTYIICDRCLTREDITELLSNTFNPVPEKWATILWKGERLEYCESCSQRYIRRNHDIRGSSGETQGDTGEV